MKRLLLFLLALSLFVPSTRADGFIDDDGVEWAYTSNGREVSLGAYGEYPVISSLTAGEVTVPTVIDGLPVTTVPALAFVGCELLTKINIQTNTTNIAPSAFNGCTALYEISVHTNNTAYRSDNRCLYSKDGKTLVRVPALTRFAATHTQTVSEQKTDVTQVVGGIDEKTGLKEADKIVSQRTYGKTTSSTFHDFSPALSAARLFAGVTAIGDYAFDDCGLIASNSVVSGTLLTTADGITTKTIGSLVLPFSTEGDGTTETTKTVSSAAGFHNGEVCFYKTYLTRTTTDMTAVTLTVPATVTTLAPLAFANAHFTNIYGADNSDQTGGGTSWTKGQKLPAWVAGNFNGVGYGADGLPFASATATISSRGKLSGKILAPSDDLTKGKTYSFSATAITDYDEATATFSGTAKMKIGKQSYALPFTIYQNTDGTGHLTIELPDGSATLVQNIWNRRDLDAPAYAKNAKVTVGGITYKYGTKGKVSWSGKVAGDNGKMLSVKGTSQLLNESQLLLYVPPKKNLLGGLCELVTLP